jgi:hypothetical protein
MPNPAVKWDAPSARPLLLRWAQPMKYILLSTLLLASSAIALGATQPFDRVIGVCHLSENPYDPTSAVNSMSVADEAVWYLKEKDHYKIEGQPIVDVFQVPAHGVLVDDGGGNYVYYPEKGYLGNDRATLLVAVGGKKVRMEYFFRVMQTIPQQYETGPSQYEASNCPTKSRVWRISSHELSN